MELAQLYPLYFAQFPAPKTRNPIRILKRKLLIDEIYRLIQIEIDRQIASREKA